MKAGRYLPSKQFSLIVVAFTLSAGLVYAADAVTKPSAPSTIAIATAPQVPKVGNWQADLASVQAQSETSLPPAPDQNTLQGLLQAAQSSNITDTISRSLLVNLAAAKQQGMGSDIPTQDQLVQNALSQLKPVNPGTLYAMSDLTVTDSDSASLHSYGNAVMDILIKSSDNEFAKTLVIIDALTSTTDTDKASLLPPIQKKYAQMAVALAAVPVPKILAPFHLELVNDYVKIAATYDGLKTIDSDPLQGAASIQQYRTLTQDAGQMFINIAQVLDKNAILFNKDEPGATWAVLLQQQ